MARQSKAISDELYEQAKKSLKKLNNGPQKLDRKMVLSEI